MARKDTLNAGNIDTLNALIANGGTLPADSRANGFNARSVAKLARMGMVETTPAGDVRVLPDGYTAAGVDTAPAEPTHAPLTSEIVAEMAADATPVEDTPAQADAPAPADPPAQAHTAADLSREQKRALAGLLIGKAGDLVEFWTETTAHSSAREILGTIDLNAAAEQFTAWLKYLPGGSWDTRLPQPK